MLLTAEQLVRIRGWLVAAGLLRTPRSFTDIRPWLMQGVSVEEEPAALRVGNLRLEIDAASEDEAVLFFAQSRLLKPRGVVWDPLAPCIAFTDGSCPLNGKSGARASYAALLTGAQFGAMAVRGEVLPFEYERVGLAAVPTRRPATPSNNRGELMAIVYCLLTLLRGCALGPVEIISDSDISIRTLLEWLPNRRRKGTAQELKNYDLLCIAESLLAELRGVATSVALTHTNSHRPRPPSTAPVREQFVWLGNDRADRHAAEALDDPTPGPSVKNAPPGFPAY